MALVMSTDASSIASLVTRMALRILFICVTTSSTVMGSP